MKILLSFLLFSLAPGLLPAQQPQPDWPEIPRVLPPVGVQVPAEVLEPIKARLAALEARFAPLHDVPFAADVAVLLKAVRFAVDIGEFYDAVKDPAKALPLLDMAEKRMGELGKAERPSWVSQTGRVARGFYSKIDGSAQPYVLEIPEGEEFQKAVLPHDPGSSPMPQPGNLLVWLHGRGEKETDLHFITGRLAKAGEFHPTNTMVLHAFGRQCIGWKSAGETDALEATQAVREQYHLGQPILAGFSMGGAGAWHIGAHYPGEWVAVHAGAGFAETARFMRLKPENYPPAIEQTLWGVYDVPDYVRNLFSLPVLAYSGEIDPQKAAADIMEEAFKAGGKALPRVIGQGMGHKYDPASIGVVTAFFDRAFDASYHSKPTPIEKAEAHIQTKTLRYPSTGRHGEIRATITGLKMHWKDSRLDIAAELQAGSGEPMINVHTRNVTSFSMEQARSASEPDPFAPAPSPSPITAPVKVDGMLVPRAPAGEETSGPDFILQDGKWMRGKPAADALRKRPGLQGPIDDAFLDPFLVVLPETSCAHPQVEKWVQYELKRFQRRWREVFRGELRQKKAREVTPEDMKKYHLVAWGDAESNPLIATALASGGLPLAWDDKAVAVTGKPAQSAAATIPVMIYPNPLEPSRYLVLNSGPTFRENHDRNNSLQNPKLPDWALLDITAPPDAEKAGRVIEAGFFDEAWK